MGNNQAEGVAVNTKSQAQPTMNNRSERMKPKFEKLRQLKDKGVILHTIWDFEEKKLCVACGKQKRVLYPNSSGFLICCDCWRKC